MKNILINEIKTGMKVLLDCGYGAHSDDQLCEILSINKREGLFGNDEICFKVKEQNGNIFDTCGFDPTKTISIE